MNLDFFDSVIAKYEPPRVLDAYKEFEGVDDPDRIRWRATWHLSYSTGLPAGIELTPYPVARKTPCGAWVDTYAYRQATKQPWEDGAPGNEWNLSDKGLWKFVHDRSGSAWAKPTRAEALRSLGVRLMRWSVKTRRDVERVNAACDVAEALLSRDSWTDTAEHLLFGPGAEARRHKIALADDDSPLAAALRRLKYQYGRGGAAPCEHVEAVLAALGHSL